MPVNTNLIYMRIMQEKIKTSFKAKKTNILNLF